MCDVNIIYVDEGKNVISYTYSDSEIDISEYLIKGNNITYSVNKLYKRDIWRNLRYEQMLFEDIALIPELGTKCTHIGYVKKLFTTIIGEVTQYPRP